MNMLRTSLVAGCAFFAVVASPANAQSITTSASVKVYPHELASSGGRSAAIDRIKGAAARVCWSGDPLVDGFKRRSCELQVTEQMIRQVENPELLAQWEGNNTIRTASRN